MRERERERERERNRERWRPQLLTAQLIAIETKHSQVGELAQTRRDLAYIIQPRQRTQAAHKSPENEHKYNIVIQKNQ